ncbi:hypothetical protein ACI3EY_08060 [Ornithinimicrobium sp. LYQ92]|uniref:hypothetical protein n=1 Tax=Serinicoccus sp. LYQ92 TaxID=3378798 RepID=UPI0038543698
MTVDGIAMEVERVSVSRSMGVRELTAATGDADLIAPDDVTERVRTPWSRSGAWPPVSGTPGIVRMGDAGFGDVQVLTGVTDKADGSVADGSVSVELVDNIDRLRRPVTMDPVAGVMPPRIDGRQTSRYAQMNGLWLVDYVMRRCGYRATPQWGSGAVVSATMMGSAWPEVGALDECVGTETAFPAPAAAPWGLSLQSPDAWYLPAGATHTLAASGPFEMMQMVVDGHNPSWTAYFGSYLVRIGWVASQVRAQVVVGGTTTTVATAARTSETRMGMLRVTVSGSTLTLEVRADTGGQGTGTFTMPAGMASAPLDRVRAYSAPGVRTGAVIARFPGTANPFVGLDYTPTTLFRRGLFPAQTTLTIVPGIVERDTLSLISEHADAVGAKWWIDELGRVVWADRAWLDGGTTPVRDLTATDDLLDLTWSHDHRQSASEVTVQWQSASTTRSLEQRVTVWEGGGSGLDTGTYEHVLHPDDLEDWLGVDTSVTLLPGSLGGQGIEDLNYLRGTLLGAARVDESSTGGEGWSPSSVFSAVAMRHVDPRTWVLAYTVNAAADALTARVPDDSFSTGVWRARYGDKFPAVRARGIGHRVQESTTSTITGPADAPALVHDASWHVQLSSHAVDLADWLASHHANSQPVLHQVPVTFDPRLQLGDLVRVFDDARSRLRITGRIVGIRHVVANGSGDTFLDVQTRTVERLDVTLGQYDTVWAAAALAARDTEWSTSTLAAFDADPLRRT